MSGFKSFALVNSKKYGSGVNDILQFDLDKTGTSLSKSGETLGTLTMRTAGKKKNKVLAVSHCSSSVSKSLKLTLA